VDVPWWEDAGPDGCRGRDAGDSAASMQLISDEAPHARDESNGHSGTGTNQAGSPEHNSHRRAQAELKGSSPISNGHDSGQEEVEVGRFRGCLGEEDPLGAVSAASRTSVELQCSQQVTVGYGMPPPCLWYQTDVHACVHTQRSTDRAQCMQQYLQKRAVAQTLMAWHEKRVRTTLTSTP
jgi:hypothetical protein